MGFKPNVSVIVCTYDEKRLNDLHECIDSILRQNYPIYEILVIVDHNEKLYHTLVDRYEKQVVKIVLNNNYKKGQASSMNYGIMCAKGDIICFIDDDAIADENWLSQLIKAYDEDTCAVGGRIEPIWLGEKPKYLPEEFYWLVGATGNYLPNQVVKVRNLWSGNISYKKEVFKRVGLFSEDLEERR